MKFRFLFTSVVVMLLCITSTSTVLAQNTYPRLTVIEEFTSATCGPCVAASTALKQVVDLRKNGIVSIRFHQNWPAPNDPWNVENPTDNDGRKDFYKVSGIPYGRMNGAVVGITNASEMLTKAQAANAAMAPLKVDVSAVKNGTKYDVSVTVTTNVALTNHKLLVGVVSRYCPYPGLSQSLPGSNGEEEFYDAMNKMLGGHLGTSINIPAGGNQTFTFNYTPGTGLTWPAGQQYIIAYVQNATSLEVLNAGTNLNLISPQVEMVSPMWEPIDKGGSATKKLRITNPTDKELVCSISIDNADNLSQAGWTATLSSEEAVIPANGSVEFSYSNTATTRALFAGISVSVIPVFGNNVVPGTIGESATVTSGYLTNGSRVAVFYGSTSGAQGNVIPALASKYGQDVVYVPLNADVLTAFPVASSYEAIILPVGFDGRFNIVAMVPLAQQMINANKGVWMSAPVGLAVALNAGNQQYAGYPEAKAFFESFGLSVANTVNRNDGQYITQFPLAGVNNDPISGGWSGTANNASQQWPFYTQAQDIIALQSGMCKSFMYADGNSSNIVGVRYEDPNSKKRFVYSSFGAEHIGIEAQRNAITERIIKYLLPEAQSNAPALTLSVQSLSFGNVEVGKTMDKSVTITNSGKGDLIINAIQITGVDASEFAVTDGAVPSGSPVTIKPNTTRVVKVQLKPTAVKGSITGALVVTSNVPTQTVQLSGSSSDPSSVATDVVSETGAIGLRLVGNNPVVDQSAVEVRANGAVTVSVVNNAGATVATLFTGQAAGTQVVSINAAQLVSGTYNVVATNGNERAVLSIVVIR